MVGGNPQHDAYGFRYWRDPGSFAEYIATKSLGRFEGFLGALWSAAFTTCRLGYLAMVAAEAKRPRIFLKRAFKTVYWRFGFFFLALEGQAPAIFKKCTKSGIPRVCFIAMVFPLLSFVAVSNGSAQAVTWLGALTEAAQLIDFIAMCVTYIFFYRALSAQGIDRRTLPYTGWYQPYCAWIGSVSITVIRGCYGYVHFVPVYWDSFLV